MNDEMKQKIIKREKMDTILAYVLLVIVLGAIILVLYLKFIRKEEKTVIPEEHPNNYITLNDISNGLNTSSLANSYLNDNATFQAVVNNNTIVIDYVKGDTNISININTIGSELEVPITESNMLISENIYKEITNIICMFYGNNEDSCRNTIDKINNNTTTEAVRFVKTSTGENVYIDTTKSIDVINTIIYNEETIKDITDTNYELLIDNVKIKDISLENSDNSIIFNGNIETDSSDFNVVITLYDKDNNIIKEMTYEYKNDNIFNVEFIFDETLKAENIKNYSINITR